MDSSVIEDPQVFIGIDVSKSAWDVHLLPEGRSFTIRVDDGAVARLREQLGSPMFSLVVLEATGGLERRLVAELIDAGWCVAVVNPRQIRDFAKALGRLAKTDGIDAKTLALFAQRVQPRPTQQTPKKQQELDALVTRRRQLVSLRSMRATLYMAALAAKRCDAKLRAFAQRLHRAGKPFKVVITACMRNCSRSSIPWFAPQNPGLNIR